MNSPLLNTPPCFKGNSRIYISILTSEFFI